MYLVKDIYFYNYLYFSVLIMKSISLAKRYIVT